MRDWLAPFGLTPNDLNEALLIQQRGSAGVTHTLAEAQADAIDAVRGRPLVEVLVALGKLAPTVQGRFNQAWESHRPIEIAAVEVTPQAARDTEAPASTAPPGEAAGAKIGRFRLLERVGGGGMGVVWKAHDPQLDRVVALKLIRPDDAGGPQVLDRFIREAKIAGSLRHPNILPVHEVGEAAGNPYLVMEFVEGRSLGDLLETSREAKRRGDPAGHANLREEVRVLADTADAVAHAHSQGVIHRDIKPQNILVDTEGRTSVIDFGLAKILQPGGGQNLRTLTQEGRAMGTPAYMSPEQAEGRLADVGPATDTYALGAVLYEILTGRTPFEAAEFHALIAAVVAKEPVPPRKHHGATPLDLSAVCLRALEKEPGRRYPSAAEFAMELRRWLRGEPVLTRAPGRAIRAWRWMRRNRLITGVAATACMLLLLTLGLVERNRWLAGETERTRSELIANLRQVAADSLEAAMAVRRAGGKTTEAGLKYLPELQKRCARVIEIAPGLAEPHYRLGAMYRALGRYDEALNEQEMALRKQPSYAPSLYERALLTLQRRGMRYAEVVRQWHRSRLLALVSSGPVGLGPRSTSAIQLQGEPLGAWLQQDQQLAASRATITADLAGLLDALAKTDHREPSSDPLISPAHHLVAQALWVIQRDEGTPTEAISLCNRARDLDPGLTDAYEALGDALQIAGRWDEAIQAYTAGISVDRGCATLYYRRSRARRHAAEGADSTDDPGDAVDDLTKAMELEPGLRFFCLSERGSLLHRTGRALGRRGEAYEAQMTAAVQDFTAALQEPGASIEPLLGRASVLLDCAVLGPAKERDPSLSQAYDDCSQAIHIAPDSGDALRLRGRICNNMGAYLLEANQDPAKRYQQAEEDLLRAIRADATDAQARTALAMVYTNQAFLDRDIGETALQRVHSAIDCATKAIALSPDNADAFFWRASALGVLFYRAYERHEPLDPHLDQARQDLDRTIELRPHHRGALTRKHYLLAIAAREARRGGRPWLEMARSSIDAMEQALNDLRVRDSTLFDDWVHLGTVYHLLAQDESASQATVMEHYSSSDRCLVEAQALELDSPKRLGEVGFHMLSWSEEPRLPVETRDEIRERAVGILAEAHQLDPADREVSASFAQALLFRSMATMDRFTGANPGDALELLAQAEADATAAIEVAASSDAWFVRGDLRLKRAIWLGAHSQEPEASYLAARSDFVEAVRANPNQSDGWNKLGDVELDRTIWRLGRAVPPERALESALINEAVLISALACYDRTVELESADPTALVRRASALCLLGCWTDALQDMEAADRLDPGAVAAHAELRRNATEQGGNESAVGVAAVGVLRRLYRGFVMIEVGDYAFAESALEEALTRAESVLALAASREDAIAQRRLLALGLARPLAHYNLACVSSLRSAGREGPTASATAISPDESALLRDRSFDHLNRALTMGWSDLAHMVADVDLAPLHTDPRWSKIRERPSAAMQPGKPR